MKGKLSRMLRSGLSLMLVFCMLISMAPAAFATEAEEPIVYVSLGASNTNGYGLFGYLPDAVSEDPLAASKADMNVYGYHRAPEAAYPAQVAAELKAWTGKEVELAQLAISSMRVEEVRYLLDDTMVPDEYMKWRFTGGQAWFEIAEPGGVNVLKKAYRDALSEADYITVDLGWNNFGVFAFNNIKTILAEGRYWNDPEFSYYEDKITEEEYKAIRNMVLEKLYENMSGTDDSLKGKLGLMADVLTTATLGACYNYDIVMEKIYELNPNVTVAVINIQNLADDLVVEFEGTELALGDLYGELIDLVNLYRASVSPYADKIVYVDAGDVTTFLDELVAWNGDPTTLTGDMKDCFDMYDDNMFVRSIVEYMMVGQALSGLFDGFRTMAAGYGLEVFKNDSEYTYEFVLTRTPEALLSLDLAALDFNNPGGPDADVELYGAAVAKHLKNLRSDEPNVAAYDYVFENLSKGVQAQIAGVNKEELQATKPQLEDAIKQMEEASLPEEEIAPWRTQLAQVNQGLLAFEAVETIIPAAKAEFEAKFKAVHKTYHNTLNYAYDVVATIFREAGKNNNLAIAASSLKGYGSVSDTLMGAVVNSFINGAMNKFYFELQENGVQETGVTEDPALMVDDVLALMKNNPAVAAISVLAVRYDLGNSFFAHPNTKGHDEITDAVMNALKNGSNADSFTEMKTKMYINELYSLLETYGPVAAEQVWKIWEKYGYVDMVEESVAKLNEKLEARYNYYANEALPAIDETISALLDQKAVLEAELAALQAELDEVLAKQEISSVHTPDIKIDVEIGNNEQTMVPDHECESDGTAEGELAAAIADLEHAIAVLEALIADIDADIADMMALAQQIAAAVAELKKTMDDVAAAGADLTAAFAAIEAVLASESGADAYTAACATAKAALDVLELANATAMDAAASIDEMMGIVAADAAALYEKVLADLPTIIEEDLMTDDVFVAGVGVSTYIGKIVYEKRHEIYAALEAEAAELQAEAEVKLAPLMEELAKLEAELEALNAKLPELEAKKAELEEAIKAEAEEAVKAAVEEELAAIQAEIEKIEAAIATVQAQIDRVNSDIATIKTDLECAIAHLENVADLALSDAVKAEVEELLKALNDALADLSKALAEKGMAAVNDLVNEIVEQVKSMIAEATTEDYVITGDSYYVALGDGSAVSESYVDLIADELSIRFANLSVDGQSLAEAPAYITANAAEIAKADLITLGYGNNTFAKKAIDRAYAALSGKTYENYNWTVMVGADGAAYVAQALADIKAELIANGLENGVADATVLAMEAYAYAAMEYTMNLPAAIAAVRAVNPDAAVVIVGMYNPLEGATLAFNESAIAVGEYLDYLVAAADVYGIGYCMLFNNANYVSAPDAETEAANREHELMGFLTEYMVAGDEVMNPNAEGHEYIKTKILNALNITVEAGTFYKKFMSGFDATTFRPNNNITRAQAAKMFGNILDESYKANYKFAGKFTDIPENFWAAKELEILSDMGVIKGFEDGSFRPNAPITRGQFAAMAVRFVNATIEGTENFSDIDKNTWCYDEVRTAVANGWIDGYEDGTYRPQGKITRAAAAKIACGMLDRPMDEAFFDAQVEAGTMKALDDTVGTWAYYWILSATNSFVY